MGTDFLKSPFYLPMGPVAYVPGLSPGGVPRYDRGMASFEPRGDSIRAIVRIPGGGKKTATFDTQEEAEAWAATMEDKKTRKELQGSAGGMIVGEMLEEYEDVARRTDSGKWNLLRLASFQGDQLASMRMKAVITHDIDEWVQRRLARLNERTGRQIKTSTVARELNLLSGAFNWAMRTRKWITSNPCHGSIPLQEAPTRKPASLTRNQIEAACQAAGLSEDPLLLTIVARTCVAWMLALETGMRSGEILRIRLPHYWRDKKTVHIAAEERGGRKGSKSGTKIASRNVPLTERAIELLDWLLRTTPKDQPVENMAAAGMLKPPYIVGLTDSQRDANWRKLAKRAGLEAFTYHDSKHEACTRLSKFLDVLELSHAVGTKDIALLRDTYYIADASRAAERLPARLSA